MSYTNLTPYLDSFRIKLNEEPQTNRNTQEVGRAVGQNLGVASNPKAPHNINESDDRAYWCGMAYKISYPVLEALSRQQLKATMPTELSTGMPAEKRECSYLEALGRTLCGIAPWLELHIDDTEEGGMRKELLELGHKGIRNMVDVKSADYVDFGIPYQALVDAAFLAQALLRSPNNLWGGLDQETQQMVLKSLRFTRSIKPHCCNWLLFSATIEVFFLLIDESWDEIPVDYAVKKHNEWYKGDGVYGDGPDFHWDYYNSFVIQPMMVDIHMVMFKKEKCSKESLQSVLNRATRFAEVQERFISPEGTFPPIGRSLCYRTGSMQALSQMALMHKLPATVKPAQVRSALTAATKRCLEHPKTFDKDGWLTLGFVGHQPLIAETYISTGSLYLTSASFLPLGLPASDPFWSDPAMPWTSVKAWSGEPFPIMTTLNDKDKRSAPPIIKKDNGEVESLKRELQRKRHINRI